MDTPNLMTAINNVATLQVCQPLMPDGTTCANPKNHGRYIVDMKCLAVGSTADQLREARMSFPSGHSSYTTFTMVFCMVRCSVGFEQFSA